MSTFNVPTRDQVSEQNQAIFDNLKSQLGFVPNLFATYAYSDNALKNYLDFSGAPSSLKAKEKEVVNLAVSEVNSCEYCLAAHTAIVKMNGYNDDQILELVGDKTISNYINNTVKAPIDFPVAQPI